jgi:phosphoribosylaminoimidazole-succinocarboxamide synthase
MVQPEPVLTTTIPGLPRHATGKVRDVYAVGEDLLLLVSTDRISAFDVILRQGIPDKGRVLTQLSAYWFEQTRGVVPNHFVTADDEAIAGHLARAGAAVTPGLRATLAGRCVLCRRATPLPIEAVVRGYLTGSAWKEYAGPRGRFLRGAAGGGGSVGRRGPPRPA